MSNKTYLEYCLENKKKIEQSTEYTVNEDGILEQPIITTKDFLKLRKSFKEWNDEMKYHYGRKYYYGKNYYGSN